MTWGVAFLLTQAIEMPIYGLATRSSGLPPSLRLAIAFGPSAVTHPAVWFVFRALEAPLGFWAYFVIAEAFAVLAEAAFLHAFEIRSPLRWSLAANATSAAVGLLAWSLGG